jgi:hypothetical protein
MGFRHNVISAALASACAILYALLCVHLFITSKNYINDATAVLIGCASAIWIYTATEHAKAALIYRRIQERTHNGQG